MKKDTPHMLKDPVSPDELAALRLLADADLRAVAELLQDCPVQALDKDEVLFTPNTLNSALHLVLRGRLRVHLDSPWTDPVQFIDVGEAAGEMLLIDGKPISVYVVAHMPTNVLIIGQETFWTLVYAEPTVARNMLQALVEQTRMNRTVVADGMELQAQHRRRTKVDELTGLRNRYAFHDALRRQTLRSSMNAKPLALLMMDINDFRRLNDTFGRAAGDRALYAVAQAIQDLVRPTDIAARVGGDKFALLLPECDERGVQVVAKRLREEISRTVIVMADQGIVPPVSVSIGVAEMRPFENAEILLKSAEEALARAKRSGRNTPFS